MEKYAIKKTMDYCDDCGLEVLPLSSVSFLVLPFDTASANEGESAVLHVGCLYEHGWALCAACGLPVDRGDGDTVSCERCLGNYHAACSEQYNKNMEQICRSEE